VFFCYLDDINEWKASLPLVNARWTGVLEKRNGNGGRPAALFIASQ